MKQNQSTTSTDRPGNSDFTVSFGIFTVIFFFIASGLVSYWNIHIIDRDAYLVSRTHETLAAVNNILDTMKDAETGQRGYILTGDPRYLEPYNIARTDISDRIKELEALSEEATSLKNYIPAIKNRISEKFKELAEAITLRRTQGFDAALAVIVSDRGKAAMDDIRSQVGKMEEEETQVRKLRLEEMQTAYRVAIVSGGLTALLGVLISVFVGILIKRSLSQRNRQEWLQGGQVGLSLAIGGEQRIEKLGENILKFLCEYTGAQAGAFFAQNNGGFKRISTYAVAEASETPESFEFGKGLLGQAAQDKRTFLLSDVPDGYLTVGSALGKGKPRHLLISPAIAENIVNAVIELGYLHPLSEHTTTLLDKVSESISTAVKSAAYRAHLRNLLEETQRQAEELQTQSEELRVSNEELEEQSRALKISQTNLEHQQAELEQINAQLEEQTQLLEDQRDTLARAKASEQLKAQELERASQYKSDFLANMSHELRTPLNSSLILAKLLADNSGGNLSSEQVKYAQTIQSSGNDLLILINDILDLSKIEAGHMEIRAEDVSITKLMKDLTRLFEPLAKQKGLTFKTEIEESSPQSLSTDCLRAEQVLKNLISNAIKFTESGSVTLTISANATGRVAFAVKDTGIGIPKEQQQAIFDAFRQADGNINRKYGGTGLGLSISRELTRLLGGTIDVSSEQGQGSTFTITLPPVYDPAVVAGRPQPEANVPRITPATTEARDKPQNKKPARAQRLNDDRDLFTPKSRSILIVEDDEPFANILYELIHELGFQCLIATSAEEAFETIKDFLPSAVVLDVGLPDHSGLSVLDFLKRNVRTRHIPVHVISADDYAETAMSLGAVGYMMKPVKRDELMEALKRIETRLNQHLRRVLIVEDNEVQRESVRKLIDTRDVETIGVGSARECLEALKNSTFDCMVLDLTLPDATGYSLLETISKEEAYSFPPVIVYTGRDISADEEQKLRRYSKSIIIKGAKSPERLLDEVTLFLHQVVADLPAEQRRIVENLRNHDAMLEGKRILIVEDDIRNIYALTSVFEPKGVVLKIARNGREALEVLEQSLKDMAQSIDLVLMDVMMPEMDGLTATREIRKRKEWKKLPVIMLTAKAMKNDQERCLEAGANDYMAKPLDVEKLLSLVRVWMPR